MRFNRPRVRVFSILLLALICGVPSLAAAQQAPSDASYPAPGHSYEAKFADRAFKVIFESAKPELTFIKGDGSSETVTYTAKELRPGLYMVYWQEANGTRVATIEDFEKGVVYTNIAAKDGKFYNLRGTWKRLD